jgi:hypothetical protein
LDAVSNFREHRNSRKTFDLQTRECKTDALKMPPEDRLAPRDIDLEKILLALD